MNKILLIITVTLLFIVPYDNAKCYDMPYSDEFYRENPDIYEQHSATVAKNNSLHKNIKQYQEDKKKSNYEKLQEMYGAFKGLANIAADGSLYQISVDNHKEIIQQEKLLAQKEFDDRNFGYRLLKESSMNY